METMYVAVSFGYWGRGDTEAEAIKQWRKAGGKFRDKFSRAVIVYRITYEAGKDKPFVDGYGSINYYGESVKIAEYNQNGKRKDMAVTA